MTGSFFVIHSWDIEDNLDWQLCDHESNPIIFVLKPHLFFQRLCVLFNIILIQDGIICDDVGWCIGLNKDVNRIYNVDIGPCDYVEGMGANNQVDPPMEILLDLS